MAYLTMAALAVVMGLVLILPFSLKKAEEELEAFLFVMGVIAVTISRQWSAHLVGEALVEPIKITAAVLLVGLLFRAARSHISGFMDKLVSLLGISGAVFAVTFALGLLSSVITAIVASLILAEVVTVLKLDRKYEIRMVVCACYAIGLGAALTPLGEPLSTIVVAKLKGPPHNAGFFYLAKLLAVWIAPGIFLTSLAAIWKPGAKASRRNTLSEDKIEKTKDVLLRAFKVYVFVMGLVFLGSGLSPLAGKTAALAPDWALFWINSVSAILDNATLAAAEIVPAMSERKITFVLMGLLVSGGMLIPGNIPNIISASKLNIKTREWAAVAVPMGAVLMLAYFIVLLAVR